MNKPIQWPLQADAVKFYGNPLDAHFEVNHIVNVDCPWAIHVGSIPVKHIRINAKCADSLKRVLGVIWAKCGNNLPVIHSLHYDAFDGSYVQRNKRGGSSLSMHAFGAALDWDAAHNPFHSSHHFFSHDSIIVECFKSEGWIWGGDWSPGSIDAMHFQAARIHV